MHAAALLLAGALIMQVIEAQFPLVSAPHDHLCIKHHRTPE
jgi:hypothetical protein